MSTIPTLQTDRLTLRPYSMDDARIVQKYCADRDIAKTTARIPHPYPDGAAEEFIGLHQEAFDKKTGLFLAIELRETGELVGGISLSMSVEHRNAELGYAIYKPWWGMGVATEASRAIVRYGFEHLDLHRIHAHHFGNNPASGRVLEKIGMKHEGTLRQAFCKWGEFQDCPHYSVLRCEFDAECDRG